MSTDGLAITEDWHRVSSTASLTPRRYADSRSTLEIKDGIWHLSVREAGYRESGDAIGRLLRAADYPAIRFFKKRSTGLLVALLYAVTKRNFATIRIPERYLEELRGYAEGKRTNNTEAAINLGISTKRLLSFIEEAEKLQP